MFASTHRFVNKNYTLIIVQNALVDIPNILNTICPL